MSKRESEIIILGGSPGCGKGTFLKSVIEPFAAQRGYKVAVAPVGDTIRTYLDEHPTEAAIYRPQMNSGLLLEDGFSNERFMCAVQQLEQQPEGMIYVFDGAPRTFGQIETSLSVAPEHLKIRKIRMAHFVTPAHICGFRVAKRGRDDDTEEAFAVRWSEYQQKTVPALQHILENRKSLNVCTFQINGQFIRSSAGLYTRMLQDHR